jgi:phosphohistidine phosphatase
MKLYLVQHGEAVSKAKDPERPLTPQGRQDVARVAAFARRAGVEIHQVWHSGKRRAEETAGILAQQLEPVGGMVAREGLGPNDHVEPVAELMKRETRSLMLVGHLPFMERLAGLLVGGDAERRTVQFRQGGVVCLERDPGSLAWTVLWSVPPDLVP